LYIENQQIKMNTFLSAQFCQKIQAGQEKGNELLLVWKKDIANHFWYSVERSMGSYEAFLVLHNE
jgi:hypothetical protein